MKEKNIYICGVIKINFDKIEVFKDDEVINLMFKEYKFLELLCKNRGKVLK